MRGNSTCCASGRASVHVRITCVDGVIQQEVNGALVTSLYRVSPRKGYMLPADGIQGPPAVGDINGFVSDVAEITGTEF